MSKALSRHIIDDWKCLMFHIVRIPQRILSCEECIDINQDVFVLQQVLGFKEKNFLMIFIIHCLLSNFQLKIVISIQTNPDSSNHTT